MILYKYQKFKSYSKGMLETGYIYFSSAEDLDDPLECSISISNKIMDGNQKEYLKDLMQFILKQLFTKGSNKKYKCIDFTDIYDDEGNLLKDCFKVNIKSADPSVKNDAIDKAIQSIEEVSNFLNKNYQFGDAFMKLLNIKKLVGVYSLTELSNNQIMWSEYAGDYTGFCIEYDIDKFLKESPKFEQKLLQLRYSNNRNNDLVKIILKAFYSAIIYGLSKKQKPVMSHDEILDIIRSKKTDYAYQKEWRLTGIPKDTSVALPIKNVFLGYKIKDRNKQIILKIARQKRYGVYQQFINQETTSLEYRKII